MDEMCAVQDGNTYRIAALEGGGNKEGGRLSHHRSSKRSRSRIVSMMSSSEMGSVDLSFSRFRFLAMALAHFRIAA